MQYAPPVRPRALYALLLALLAAPSAAQQRRPARAPSALPPARCTAQWAPLAAASPELAPAVEGPLALVAAGSGLLLAWSTRGNSLVLARVSEDGARVAEDRTVGAGVSAWALSPGFGGAALAWAEALPGGEVAVLLARVDERGEARNVPRELGRARSVDRVSVQATTRGLLVSWGATGGQRTGTWVRATDSRGVPRAPAQWMTEELEPVLVAVADSAVLRTGRAAEASGHAWWFDPEGALLGMREVPRAALAEGPGGADLLALREGPEASAWTLERWSPTGAESPPLALQPRPPAGRALQWDALADNAGWLAVFDDGERHTVLRVGADGAWYPLVQRAGRATRAARALSGRLWAAGLREAAQGRSEVVLAPLRCP